MLFMLLPGQALATADTGERVSVRSSLVGEVLVAVHRVAVSTNSEAALNISPGLLRSMGAVPRANMDHVGAQALSSNAAAASVTPLSGASPPAQIQHIFPDPALANFVASWLGGAVNAVVTQAELDQVTQLVIFDHIASLEGVQYLRELVEIDVWNGSFHDLSPLFGLVHLNRLWIIQNDQMNDLSPLAGLVNLTDLALYGEWNFPVTPFPATDFSPLSGLVNLEQIQIGVSKISDISFLSGMDSLNSLHFWDTHVSDLSPVLGLDSLQNFHVDQSRVTDFSPLGGMPSLIWFGGWGQEVTLEPMLQADVISIPNMVRDFQGDLVSPWYISDGGVYANGTIAWNGLTTQEFVRFYWNFSDSLWGWEASGSVTIPLRERTLGPIELNRSGEYTFPSRAVGAEPGALIVTARNRSGDASGNLAVRLSGANADSFEFTDLQWPITQTYPAFRSLGTGVTSFGIPNLEGGGETRFIMRPVANLPVGTYTATVTVSGAFEVSEYFDVVFVVQ